MLKLFYQNFTPSGLKKGQALTNSSNKIITEAEKLDIKWQIIPGTQVIKLSYNNKDKYYYHQIPFNTKAIAMYCDDKNITRNLLYHAGIIPKKSLSIS